MNPRTLRALRGTTAAAIATILAATSHTLAGGGAPAPALVFALAILTAPLAVLLVGRRLSVWRSLAVVLATQLPFHLAFAVTAGVDPTHLAGHVHHVSVASGPMAGMALPDAPMTVGHMLAAVLTVLMVHTGERMLRALGRGIRTLFARAREIPPFPASVTPAPSSARRAILADRVVLSGLSRRGPPAFVSTAS